MEDISKRLKNAMDLRGFRPVDLCRETGISKSLVSQYLGGTRLPKHGKIYLIAKALNVDEAWLMGYDTDMARRPRGGEAQIMVGDPGELTLLAAYRTLNERDRLRVIEQACELSELSRLRSKEVSASSAEMDGADIQTLLA